MLGHDCCRHRVNLVCSKLRIWRFLSLKCISPAAPKCQVAASMITRHLGATGDMHIREKKSSNSQFGADQINPVSTAIMTRHHLFITRQFWQSKIGKIYIFKSAEYQLNISRPIFLSSQSIEGRLKWIISYSISLQEPMSANWLWSWPIDPEFLEEVPGFFALTKLKHICWGDLLWIHGRVSRRKWQGLKDDQGPTYKNF